MACLLNGLSQSRHIFAQREPTFVYFFGEIYDLYTLVCRQLQGPRFFIVRQHEGSKRAGS